MTQGRVQKTKLFGSIVSALTVCAEEGVSSLFWRICDRLLKTFKRAVLRQKDFWHMEIDEQYQVWLKNNELTGARITRLKQEASKLEYTPKISVIMPLTGGAGRYLRSAIQSVTDQLYQNWELCIAAESSLDEDVKAVLQGSSARDPRIKIRSLPDREGVSWTLNEALNIVTGDFVSFLGSDDEITRDALLRVAMALNRDPTLDLIYSDEDKVDVSGRRVEPFFKPDWSPDLLLSMNYISNLTVVRRSLLEKAGVLRQSFNGSDYYNLILRITELTDQIGHIPKPLYSMRKKLESPSVSIEAESHLRESAKRVLQEALKRRGIDGEVLDSFGGHYRVRYAIEGSPLVSIIISTRDRVDLLRPCIESIESKTSYKNYEIIVIDNASTDPKTVAYLDSLDYRVLRYDKPFNLSKILNFGARHAKGVHLLFLNNDTEVLQENWIEAMLEHSQRREVGVVGVLLLYPSWKSPHASRIIQHAGVVVGAGGRASEFSKGCPSDQPNYFSLHQVIRNCSAVSLACGMIRRDVFDEVGGWDERMIVGFIDVDLCLRIRERGYLVVYTPHAPLYHYEYASRGKYHPPEDETIFLKTWESFLIKGDVYYNPNLTLLRERLSLASEGSEDAPLAVLLDVYHSRLDLRWRFPEVRKGDYARLIKWAVDTGTKVPSTRNILKPYRSYYASSAS